MPQLPVYRKTRLRNGLRVVTERLPSVRSIALGVWVDTGSRDERPDEHGISHLIEHMVFKGTENRNAREIAASLESIGGGLNAFTSREQTCFTARVLDEHLDLAVDVLADLACRARLSPPQLKREKLVVCEEIKESLENPSDFIHDLFSDSFWKGQPIGRPILGTAQSVADMPRRALTRYIDRQYRTGSVVVAASGSVSHERLVRLVRKSFSFEEGEPERGPQATIPEEQTAISRTNGAEQVHLCLGLPGLRFSDSNKIPLLVLTTHLGSGMSSVLFQKVREQHGLAYTVYCYHDAYRDAGIFGAYFATDARAWPKAVDVTLGEFKRVTKRRLAPERLEQVKSQLKGQLVLGMESTPARMNRLARNELMLGRYVPVAETLADVDSVTGDDVLEAARRVFDQPAIVATALGPVKEAALRNAL